jgi:dolichyl-phosphate-mannose-protein mannosyltransferase
MPAMKEYSRLPRILWFAVWLALAIFSLLTVWLGVLGLVYPYQLDYGEGIVLWFAREIAHGHSIYKGIVGYPYASSNYPPITFLLTVALMPIFGDGYMAGRLLSLASIMIIGALIYRMVRDESGKSKAAALAALFFVGSAYIYHWAPLFRVDLIGLAFAFLGIYFCWRYEQLTDGRKKLYLVFSTFAFLLSLYTKQTLIAAPAAAFFAIFRRDKRAALLFAMALGAMGGAIYLAIDYATRGAFTFGLIDSNATVFLPAQLFELLGNFAVVFAVLIGLAVWEWFRRIRSGRFGILEAYALSSLATLVFAGRVGAWENYFFEAVAIGCLLAGFAIANLELVSRRQGSSALIQAALPASLLIQLFLYTQDHDPRVAARLVTEDYLANKQLAALLSRTSGIVISEDMGALVTSGKDVGYYTFQYSSLARSGKWDQSWELNGLRDSIFPLVVLERGTREDVDHYRRFTREFVSALDRYYAQTETIGKYEIYSPSPLANLQSVDFGDSIAMVGWTCKIENSEPETIELSIVWQARLAMPRRYTAFVHLENARGDMISQDDHEPRGGLYPTTRWAATEIVRDNYKLSLPGNPAAGKYVIRVGWYDTGTGERLYVSGSADDSVEIMAHQKK